MASTSVFIRKASGLRRDWSQLDAFFYNFLNVTGSPFGSGIWFSFLYGIILFPGADIVWATVISGVMIVPVILSYALMASSYPRTGADYIYMSRNIGPSVGFSLTLIAQVLFSAGWLAIIGRLLARVYLPTFMFLLGYKDLAAWLPSKIGVATVASITIVVAVLVCSFGMKFLSYWIRSLFAIITVATLVFWGLLAANTNASFIQIYNGLMGTGAYQSVIEAAKGAGWAGIQPFDWWQTFVLSAYTFGFFMYGQGAIPYVGEIKNVSKVRLTIISFLGATLISVATYIITFALLRQVLGSEFWAAFAYNSNNGVTTGMIPWAFPYVGGIVALLAGGGLAIVAVLFLITVTSQQMFFQTGNVLVQVKYLFAYAFDGLLPPQLAFVENRTRAPLVAVGVAALLGFVWLALGLYSNQFLIFNAITANIFSFLVLLLGTAAAALLFPFRSKATFQASPVSKYMIGGLPVVSLVGFLGVVSSLSMIALYWLVPELGATGIVGAAQITVLYISVIVVFFILRAVRKRQGYDIDMAFREVPPE